MSFIARIAVNVPGVSGVYDYEIPINLHGQIKPGCLVTVPFGQQILQGIVTELPTESSVSELKLVMDLIDPWPAINPHQLQLANWLSEYYFSTLADFLHLMIPPGLNQHADTLFSLNKSVASVTENISVLQTRIINLIATRGPLRGRQIDSAIPRQNWRTAAKVLIGKGWLQTQSVLPKPTVNRKMVRTAQLACSPQVAESRLADLTQKKSDAFVRRQAMLKFLIKEAMPVNVSWIYAETGGSLVDLRKLEELELIQLSESEVWRDPLGKLDILPDTPPELTPDQQNAWAIINEELNSKLNLKDRDPILIHGVTGSGKTELYIRAAQEVIRKGMRVLILVPEISLTPQTIRRFVSRFPGQVGLIHSRLSPGERYDTWRKARAGLLSLVVGPRSALFTPLSDLGLIVIDECHDDSYYQAEFYPLYHAVNAAIAYSQITEAVILLGSATPSVEMVYRAQKENWNVIHLPIRILAHQQVVQKRMESINKDRVNEFEKIGKTAASLPLPFVHIVDMREELKGSNRSIFSNRLRHSLHEVLQNDQQAILFLNRRGSATYVFCRECGYVARCPRCDLPLASHVDQNKLICHTCAYQRGSLEVCPQCGKRNIREYGTGTQKVERLVKEEFPEARVIRWDTDTARQKGAEEILLSHFVQHRADVLIGTQMLAKGLDLPFVTLVGVVLADVGLNFPDYRAVERTFQVLMQVAGRAGRSLLGGQVVLQTFQPWHYAIQRAAQHDFEGFYSIELEHRRKLEYPPFKRLVRLEISNYRLDETTRIAQDTAEQICTWLRAENNDEIEVIGPAPAFFGRISGKYRWQILLKGADPVSFLRHHPLTNCTVEVDPPNIL